MNNLSGGYIMVDLSSPNKVKQLEKAAALNKPLLVYYEDGTTEWGKVTVTYETVDDVEVPTYHITTANGFVTVEADGDTTARPLLIEGDGDSATITGFTALYNKWSLSGTHLMLVLAGSFENATTITANTILTTFELPSYIFNKIYPIQGNYIETKVISCRGTDWSSQDLPTALVISSGKLQIKTIGGSSLTMTTNRAFRIQFDLLIDNE